MSRLPWSLSWLLPTLSSQEPWTIQNCCSKQVCGNGPWETRHQDLSAQRVGACGPLWSVACSLYFLLRPDLIKSEYLTQWISLHSRFSNRCHCCPLRKPWELGRGARPAGQAIRRKGRARQNFCPQHVHVGQRCRPQAPQCSLTDHQVGGFLWWGLSVHRPTSKGPWGQNKRPQ